jgi:hypothetical protein
VSIEQKRRRSSIQEFDSEIEATCLSEGSKMLNRLTFTTAAAGLAGAMIVASLVCAQNAPSVWNSDSQNWNQAQEEAAKKQKAPAPHRDLTGTWDVGGGAGIQQYGAKNMPSDGKPEHQLPYTPFGRETFMANKPGWGETEVYASSVNDPVDRCDPAGFPRADLFELRATQIVQLPKKVLLLYQFQQVWRTVWTDGRELPKDPETRWYGYSVGKWEDDYTFVVQSNGMDERTWLDNAGRPHSSNLRVEERFHRLDRDTMELTVIINDPQIYTKPWVAADKFPLHLRPDEFDVREMICSPTETEEYNKAVTTPVGTPAK